VDLYHNLYHRPRALDSYLICVRSEVQNLPRPTFRNPLPRLAFRLGGALVYKLAPPLFRCSASLLVPLTACIAFMPASDMASLMASGPTSS